jgi:hypothetical protein
MVGFTFDLGVAYDTRSYQVLEYKVADLKAALTTGQRGDCGEMSVGSSYAIRYSSFALPDPLSLQSL